MYERQPKLFVLCIGAVVLLLAGCGGSDKSGEASSQSAPTTAPTVTTTGTASSSVYPGTAPSGSPAFRIALGADNHRPAAGAPWHFRVAARSPQGPVTGATAKVYVFQGSQEVDGVGWFVFNGTLDKAYPWPEKLRGAQAVFLHVEVQGPGGVRRANWPVRVR
jgi:hypothetical protein